MLKQTVLLVIGGLLASSPHVSLAATAAPPAAQSTGSVTGRVQNVATGQYLNNARVTIRGTNNTVFTDKDGTYRLVNVPSGPVTLEVFFTDLDLATITLNVPAGGIATQDVNLTSIARYGQQSGDGTVKLDAFIVAQDKETDAQAIATNEQRFAPNIKNVLSTDSLGDVLGGSVGEFMKFLPGVTVESDLADVSGVSIRGIGGSMTSITNDGAPASNIWVSATRSVDVRSMALNDIARMEVSKVPTPANPADSLAGSINLVSKSAFERSGRQLRYSLNLIGNHENLDLKKTPHSHGDKETYKIFPGVSLDFTWPVTKRFGVVVAANHSRSFNEQHRTLQTWSSIVPPGSPAGTPINYANPVLNSLALLDGPRDLTRNTLSVKTDWKITDNGVLSIGHVASRTDTRIGSLSYTWNTSTTATSSIAGGRPLTWDGTQTLGATGRGTLNNNGTNQLINQITDTSNIGYRYDNGRWRVETGVSRSASQTKRRYFDAGFFLQTSAIQRFPVRINFLDLAGGAIPGRIEVFDNNNNPIDWNNPANLRGNTANNSNLNNRSYTNQGFVNVRRTLDFMPVPTAVQTGVLEKRAMLDTNIRGETWTFMGPDGASAATAPIEPYLMQRYRGVETGYGVPSINWMSPSRAFRAYQLNPLLYQQTEAQRVADRNGHIDNNENIKEKVQAAYLQGDTRLFRSRLRVLGGVRFEKTIDHGIGGLVDMDRVWQRNADGSYVRNAAGARVRRPEAGAAGSYAESLLTREYRAFFTQKEYDGYYPSIHLTYNTTENFLLRAAWAKTYGRPNFSDIIPRTVATSNDFDEDDELQPNQFRGTINIRNPSLMPWTADNYDLSAEYYTESGGLITGGIFLKELKDFFGDSSRRATPELLNELGLSPRYLDWNINTKFNSGDARITGAEINLRQNLRIVPGLGKWGSYFTLFANGTKLDLDGNPGASFTSFIPKSANWGFTFAPKRITFTARWNYRGLDKRAPQAAYGPNGYEYIEARTVLDVNGSYQITKNLSFVASATNIFNKPYRFLRYGDQTPDYAKLYAEQEYGIQMAIGLRGQF